MGHSTLVADGTPPADAWHCICLGADPMLRACIVSASLLLWACSNPASPTLDGAPPNDAASDAGPDGCASDAECDDGVYCNGFETCRPSAGADERGCRPSAPRCLASQSCDEDARRCVTACDVTRDADGDGALAPECGGDDCDDADPARYPGATEICDPDDRDEDCDVETFGYRDVDQDGYPDDRCCNEEGGRRECGSDCNDRLGVVHPTEAESCDGLDNDCNGDVDDGVMQLFWPDADGDDFGDSSAEPVRACTAPPDHASNGDDCDDTNARRNPGAPEVCDGLDNDCNGRLDAFNEDLDGDGYGNRACGGNDCLDLPPPPANCTLDQCERRVTGCYREFDRDIARMRPGFGCEAQFDSAKVHPGATERCDREDWNCDGRIEDADLDYELATDETCVDDAVIGLPRIDCNDGHEDPLGAASRINTYSPEFCDRLDNDCDGAVDECSIPNASGTCDATRNCVFTGCAPGPFADCDANTANGCDDLRTSGRHCGRCGNACAFACREGAGCDGASSIDWSGLTECAVTASGALYCRGGVHVAVAPLLRERASFARLTLPPVAQVALSNSWNAACARTQSGELWCWRRDQDPRGRPRFVAPTRVPMSSPVVDLALGAYGACTIGDAGELCCWGAPVEQIPELMSGALSAPLDQLADAPRCAATSFVDVEIATGDGVCLRDAAGAVRCHGRGLARDVERAPAGGRYGQIALGYDHGCGVRASDGRVECWGWNHEGQLGVADRMSRGPVLVGTSAARAVGAGNATSCAVWIDGTVSCWGNPSAEGSLGDGSVGVASITPVAVRGLRDIRTIRLSSRRACAIDANGAAWCWGTKLVQGPSGTYAATQVPIPEPLVVD